MSAPFLRQITLLDQQISQLFKSGHYQEAIPFASQLRDLIEQHLGQFHPSFGQSLNSLGALYYKTGNYDVAEPLFRRALEILSRTIGQNHPTFARGLDNLAGLYQDVGKFTEAEPLSRQALEIWRKVLGNDHPDFATRLNNLACLYCDMCDYARAESLHRQALEIRRKALGEDHADFAVSLNNLGVLYRAMGNFAAAKPFYQQALEIRRMALGETHPDFAQSVNGLAALYYSMGNYPAAEPLQRHALEIRRKTLGESHPNFAVSLNNLAALLDTMGNYAAAEPLYRQALEIRLAALGKDHLDVAQSLMNLAGLYRTIGNYTSAELFYRQAIEIQRKVLGGYHPDLAISLDGLASLYQDKGNFADAEILHREALEVRRTAYGENHLDFSTGLNNLAVFYGQSGNFAVAEGLYRQALEIKRSVLEKGHPGLVGSLNNLGELYLEMGKYVEAETMLREALQILRKTVGEKHPEFAGSLENLVAVCVATGRKDEALGMMKEIASITDDTIGQIFSIGSENQRMAYLNNIVGRFDAFVSLALHHFPDSSKAVSAVMELVLRRKAIGAEALAIQRDAVLGGRYQELKPKLEELTALRMQIVQKTLAGAGREGLQPYQKHLAEWNAQKEALEAELARQVPEMNLTQKLRAADRQAVALALPEKASLVEFVRFNVFDFKAVPARGEPPWKPARYIAFVLPAGEPDNLRMIDLGEAAPIDRMIATFRSAITGEAESRGKRDLGVLLSEPVGEPDTSEGTSLRAALFDPLLPAIGDCKRLLLAPDGDLTRLPFEALPTDDGRRLIDDYQISYLGTGRDALRFGAASSGQPTAALVAADPDFDLSGGQAHTQATSEAADELQNARRVSREIHTGDLERLGRLPGTRVEGERIASMLRVKPLLGEEALEARIKACRSPRILHLATHGFFLADQRRDPNRELRGLGLIGGQAGDGFGQMSEMPSGRMSGPGMENPLLRSGVILAGFKTWLTGGGLPAEAEDGLLTAEDVTGLDLLATELVVLSACETGLGEVRTGEGVFGLRRAFVLAGAKTLVMSLWKAPDLATAILMERFYDNLLNRRDSSNRPFSRSESLREAQFHTRGVTIGQIRDHWLNAEMIERLSAGNPKVRRELQELAQEPDDYHPFTHPLYWGAFICQGDPGPLP